MLILASASPRRKEILQMLGYTFEIKVSDCDESVGDMSCEQAVAELSKRKAKAVDIDNKDDVVIGCDTLVCIDGRKLGKPKNRPDAKRMLNDLSGKIHTVYTGVTIIKNGVFDTFVSKNDVEFFDLDEETIDSYIASGECNDKAGAYAVQGKGSRLIKRIEGDFFAIMGLPAGQLCLHLKQVGILPNK